MRILMVSIPSLHFYRWVNQLKDSSHDIYWFDISGMSKSVERINWVNQITDWKLRWRYPGRIKLKRTYSFVHRIVDFVNNRKTEKVFEEYYNKIQPDLVHSFGLYLSCTPIINILEKHPKQKWAYSSWGSDLYYFQNKSEFLRDINRILPRINYLFTDCLRDKKIAYHQGFNGKFLGVFPGGGGYKRQQLNKYYTPLKNRKMILIKGYQGRSGRAIEVLKGMTSLRTLLSTYEIVIFGSDPEVFSFLSNSGLLEWSNLRTLGKINHDEVLELMGKSLVYIGNSNSDGIPNTLLEAILMDVFPIQSNPGGATSEIIKNGLNGILIEDCESISEIKNIIQKVFVEGTFSRKSFEQGELISRLDFNYIKRLVNKKYGDIEKNNH